MNKQKVIDAYNVTAEAYAVNLFDELSKKPFDRMVLTQFAAENNSRGRMIDLGCGPGQTTKFLAQSGVVDITGTDISPGMIEQAQRLNPGLMFETADMLALHYPDDFFASAVALYSIVHFTSPQIQAAFSEVHRVLKNTGQLLLSFHIGDETIHRSELFGVPVDMDFHFFPTEKITELLKQANFKIVDAIERYPYKDVEHPSKRAYIWAEKI